MLTPYNITSRWEEWEGSSDYVFHNLEPCCSTLISQTGEVDHKNSIWIGKITSPTGFTSKSSGCISTFLWCLWRWSCLTLWLLLSWMLTMKLRRSNIDTNTKVKLIKTLTTTSSFNSSNSSRSTISWSLILSRVGQVSEFWFSLKPENLTIMISTTTLTTSRKTFWEISRVKMVELKLTLEQRVSKTSS